MDNTTNTSTWSDMETDDHIKLAMYTLSIVAIFLGVPGNMLIIHAVRSRRQMQNARNYFIVSLACSDIVALLIFVPFYNLNLARILHYMPEVACKTLMPTGVVLVTISAYTHGAISLERRRAIVFPLLPKPSQRRIKSFIAIVWLVPAVVLGPLVYFESNVHKDNFCVMKNQSETDFVAGIIFVIPLGVLTLSYRQIISTLNRNTAPMEELGENNLAVALRLKNQRKVVNSLIALVCAFVVLTFPYIVFVLISSFVKETHRLPNWLGHAARVISPIRFMIYALNPVILYLSSTEYRLAFHEIFKVWKKFFCRTFSWFNKRKFQQNDRSKATPSVIVLSVINKGCEGK